MLTNLFATLFVTLGVGSNLHPICNKEATKEAPIITQPKQANDQTDFTINIDIDNTQTQSGQTDSATFIRMYKKSPFYQQSTYIDVRGDVYQQETKEDNTTYGQYERYVGNGNNLLSSQGAYIGGFGGINRPMIMYAIQLTPYNYNLDTNLRLGIRLQADYSTLHLGDVGDYWGWQYAVNQRIYSTTDLSWANFIDMQLAPSMPATIEDEIRDINNGYYYQYQERTNYYSNTNNVFETYTYDITITPQRTNYIIATYELIICPDEATYTNTYYWAEPTYIEETTTYNNYLWRNYYGSAVRITGTNIIPSGTYEVVDIGGLCFQILTMPFAFISTAFNLTLFPGTQYQINISNLFLAIFAILVFIMIIKVIIKVSSTGA